VGVINDPFISPHPEGTRGEKLAYDRTKVLFPSSSICRILKEELRLRDQYDVKEKITKM
jgi:hypothetical protein